MTEHISLVGKPGITCIVPARNESGHLKDVVKGIVSLNRVSEIIIVEGGSSDDTWEVAKNLEASKLFQIKAMKQEGSGKFNAVLEAAMLAEYSHIIIWDADGTVSLEDTHKLIDYFFHKASSDVVIGNRLFGVIHPGAMQKANWFGNWLFAILWWPFLGLRKPADLLCGTKIIPTSILMNIPNWLRAIDPYGDFSIIATCVKNNFKIHSFTVDYFPRTYGSTNIRRWSGGTRLLITSMFAFIWIARNRLFKGITYNQNLTYIDQLWLQRDNASQPSLQAYLDFVYGRVKQELCINHEYLELGAGAGISNDFLGEYSIQRTDYLDTQDPTVKGNVDAHALPFRNEEFDGVILFDTFHHFENPLVALKECIRVTKPGGQIILIEPYVSFLSFPVYRIFHFEETSWKYDFNRAEKIEKAPENGDQGISKSLIHLLNDSPSKKVNLKFSDWKVSYITPFSFFLTGGSSTPLNTPAPIIRLLLGIERLIPKILMKLIAARVVIVIHK